MTAVARPSLRSTSGATPPRRPRRSLVALGIATVLALGAVAAQPGGAGAQATDPSTTASTTATTTGSTTTTIGPTTTTSPSTTSTTTTPSTTEPLSTTTTLVPETSTTLTAAPPGEPAPTPVDAVDEDGSEAPPTPPPVPRRTTPRLLTPADGAVTQAVTAEINASTASATAAVADAKAADKVLADLEAHQAELQRAYEALQGDDARAATTLQSQRGAVRTRAVALYMTGGADPLIPVGTDVYDYGRKRVLIQALHAADQRSLVALQAAKVAAGADVDRLVGELEGLNGQVITARAGAEQAAQKAQQSLGSLAQVKATATVAVNGFVFPVGDPHNFASTFGAPRMTGTPYFHLHQGNDIFAPYGTALFACERGVIFKMGTDRLGGTKLWVAGESGTTYYYAHLSAFAAGLQDGQLVEAGDVVGYVGNTGNAATTPPHLHFEIHPGGGAAIDPYPTLKTVDDAQKQYGSRVAPTTTSSTTVAPLTTVAP